MPGGQARKSLWIETDTVRLPHSIGDGQARKSLWIETSNPCFRYAGQSGQARKSLWIETVIKIHCDFSVQRSGS